MKIGHGGTLDPLASGVLPLALGEATKTMQFCMDNDKEYEFTVKWGEETTTCDAEGEIINTSPVRPTKEQILAILPEFTGEISQAPPQYSAIKINGRRAYDLAREGVEVEMTPRKVRIYSLEIVSSELCKVDSKEIQYTTHNSLCTTFKVSCGKGTYVRSLARDIALKLGTFGYVTKLIRTKVGKFDLGSAILLEDIEKAVYKDAHSGVLLPVDSVLDDIQVLEFTPEEAARLRFGQKINATTLACNASGQSIFPGGVFIVKCEGVLVAISEFEEEVIRPLRVFNL